MKKQEIELINELIMLRVKQYFVETTAYHSESNVYEILYEIYNINKKLEDII